MFKKVKDATLWDKSSEKAIVMAVSDFMGHVKMAEGRLHKVLAHLKAIGDPELAITVRNLQVYSDATGRLREYLPALYEYVRTESKRVNPRGKVARSAKV